MDVSSKLPQLIRRPGLTTWRPTADRSAAVTFGTYEEFMSSPLDDALKARMSEGHWPPKNTESLNLPRWYVFILPVRKPHIFLTNLTPTVCGYIHISKIRVDFLLQFWKRLEILPAIAKLSRELVNLFSF